MTTPRDYRETFKRTPHIRALWDRMKLFSLEYPECVLVKDSPFLIGDQYEIVDFPDGTIFLVPPRLAKGYDVLRTELILIGEMIQARVLSKKQLRRLERRSKFIHKTVDEVSLRAAMRMARYLKAAGQLH